MKKRTDLIPINKTPVSRRSGIKNLGVKFIVAHDTGNVNSTAKNNVDFYKRTATQDSASAHIFVDDIESVTCVPLDEKAWHVLYNVPTDNQLFGDDANDIAIGVELCYFDDKERSKKAYENYVQVLGELCKKYNINPKTHMIGHETLDPRRKTDPTNALKRIGKTYQDLTNEVYKAFKGDVEQKPLKVNKNRCVLTVAFSPTSIKLNEFRQYLLELGVTHKLVSRTVTIGFAPKSQKYGLIVQWLEDRKISFKEK